ncbi:MAG: TIGR04086 family membrane protein [Clostridia bacterium]|nr:TIGR04086 family membrane protein [Clostridia bacterium]
MKAASVKQEPRAHGKFLIPLLCGIIAAFIVSIIVLALLSMVFTMRDMPQTSVIPLSYVAYGLGALAGGLLTARLYGNRGLVSGALTGLLFFIVIYITGAAMHNLGAGGLAFVKLALSIFSGGLGGIIGVNAGRKKRSR